MNDGIIKGDGTSRKMKATLPATYEEFRQAAGAGEQTLDVMFNAPGWQQQPTFLNKQNLLKDKTASVYNYGPEGTVDDVFQSVFAVGDIKVSTRTDLGDSWLLCNGAIIDKEKYPVLSGMLADAASSPTSSPYGNYTPPGSAVYSNKEVVDNYLFAFGFQDYTKYAYKPINSPAASWTEKTFPRGVPLATIQKLGGKYIVHPSRGSEYLYADNINGPWKSGTIKIPISGYWSSVDLIDYANGVFVAFLQNTLPDSVTSTDSRGVAYTTDLSGEWKFFKPPAFNAKRRMESIGYMQGKWVLFGRDFARDEVGIKTVSTGSDITSLTETYSDTKTCLKAVCVNDKIYAAQGDLFVMDDVNSDFRTVVSGAGTGIVYGDGWIFTISSSKIHATEVSSEKHFALNNSSGAQQPSGFGNGYFVTTGNPNYFYIKPKDVVVKYLPKVSISNAYAYIRGK